MAQCREGDSAKLPGSASVFHSEPTHCLPETQSILVQLLLLPHLAHVVLLVLILVFVTCLSYGLSDDL